MSDRGQKDVLLFLFGAFIMFIVMGLYSAVFGADFSVSGYAQQDDAWRITAGYHAPSLKIDWYRQTKNEQIVDGYDVTIARSVSFAKLQYRGNHKSNALDTQEISGMGTFHGVGLGVARSWVGEWDKPRWTAKAQYVLDRRYLSIGMDWASNFGDRRSWSLSPRVKIPAWAFFSFALSGKWQEVQAGGEATKWWSLDGGLSIEIPAL